MEKNNDYFFRSKDEYLQELRKDPKVLLEDTGFLVVCLREKDPLVTKLLIDLITFSDPPPPLALRYGTLIYEPSLFSFYLNNLPESIVGLMEIVQDNPVPSEHAEPLVQKMKELIPSEDSGTAKWAIEILCLINRSRDAKSNIMQCVSSLSEDLRVEAKGALIELYFDGDKDIDVENLIQGELPKSNARFNMLIAVNRYNDEKGLPRIERYFNELREYMPPK